MLLSHDLQADKLMKAVTLLSLCVGACLALAAAQLKVSATSSHVNTAAHPEHPACHAACPCDHSPQGSAFGDTPSLLPFPAVNSTPFGPSRPRCLCLTSPTLANDAYRLLNRHALIAKSAHLQAELLEVHEAGCLGCCSKA